MGRCLLITGTIKQNVVLTIPEDPAFRRQRYLDSLLFYSEMFEDPIFFLENSGYDFSGDDEFEKLLRSRSIELLAFPRSVETTRGKGYQEFEMIDSAVQRIAKRHETFIKITGRYYVTNLKHITSKMDSEIIIDLNRRFKIAFTSVFVCSTQFYLSKLLGKYELVDDAKGAWIERILFREFVDENLLSYQECFPERPLISLYDNKSEYSLKSTLKTIFNNLERKYCRRVGIKTLWLRQY